MAETTFVKVCKVSDIPAGEGRTVPCGEEEVAVFNVNGQFYAVQNTCPHRGGPLGEGSLEGTIVTCPWHGWQFDVASGSSPVNPSARVQKYPVKIEGENISISQG